MFNEYLKAVFHMASMLIAIYVFINSVLAIFFVKEKRKKILDIILRVMMIVMIPMSIFSIVLAVLIEGEIIKPSIWLFVLGHEVFCYMSMSAAYLLVYRQVIKRKKLRSKIILGIVGSVLYTAEVFLVNNTLHIIFLWAVRSRNASYFWLLLKHSMAGDLAYNNGLGIYRYVIVFVLQLLAFSAVAAVKSERVRKKTVSVIETIKMKFSVAGRLCFKKSGLIQLTDLYADEKIAFTAIDEYLCRSKYDTYMMHDLMFCIKRYAIPLYSDLLFSIFGESLSKEQYIKYREICLEGNDVSLCAACEALDNKYGIKYSGEYREAPIERYQQAANDN